MLRTGHRDRLAQRNVHRLRRRQPKIVACERARAIGGEPVAVEIDPGLRIHGKPGSERGDRRKRHGAGQHICAVDDENMRHVVRGTRAPEVERVGALRGRSEIVLLVFGPRERVGRLIEVFLRKSLRQIQLKPLIPPVPFRHHGANLLEPAFADAVRARDARWRSVRTRRVRLCNRSRGTGGGVERRGAVQVDGAEQIAASQIRVIDRECDVGGKLARDAERELVAERRLARRRIQRAEIQRDGAAEGRAESRRERREHRWKGREHTGVAAGRERNREITGDAEQIFRVRNVVEELIVKAAEPAAHDRASVFVDVPRKPGARHDVVVVGR